jgi:probable HAF family extracellular repeat protein
MDSMRHCWTILLAFVCACTSRTEVFGERGNPGAGGQQAGSPNAGAAAGLAGVAGGSGGTAGLGAAGVDAGSGSTGCLPGDSGCQRLDFETLEPPAGTIEFVANATNFDGSVVVGYYVAGSVSEPYRPYRWTPQGGAELPVYPGDIGGNATAVNADGTVVIGTSTLPDGGWRAVRWEAGTVTDLGITPGTELWPVGVDANGKTSVGQSELRPFLHTPEAGFHPLALPADSAYGYAYAVNGDGSIVVGGSSTGGSLGSALRWTFDGATEALDEIAENATATAVSADGSVIAGYDFQSDGARPVRWTAGGGPVDLGVLTALATTTSYASGISADGSVIVGGGGTGLPWIWRASTGTRSLRDVLSGAGVDLTGWDIRSIVVSGDGRVVVGAAVPPGQNSLGYRAKIPQGP